MITRRYLHIDNNYQNVTKYVCLISNNGHMELDFFIRHIKLTVDDLIEEMFS